VTGAGVDTAGPGAETAYVANGAGSPPIVGRIAERDAMSAAYAGAVTGRPQLLLITGEAGIGKTRLVEELVRQVE
jgi:MoxR-like ATPase